MFLGQIGKKGAAVRNTNLKIVQILFIIQFEVLSVDYENMCKIVDLGKHFVTLFRMKLWLGNFSWIHSLLIAFVPHYCVVLIRKELVYLNSGWQRKCCQRENLWYYNCAMCIYYQCFLYVVSPEEHTPGFVISHLY